MENLQQIKALVGNITEEQLKYVDCYVSDGFGVFVPSVGFCMYAIQPQHTHPSYSSVILPPGNQGILIPTLVPDEHHYLAGLLSPNIPHEEKPGETFQRYYAIFISEERFQKACFRCGKPVPSFFNWQQFLIPKKKIAWVHAFMKEYDSTSPEKEETMFHWSSLIIYELIRRGCSGQGEQESRNYFSHSIEDIIQYVHANFHKKLNISDLSMLANMSESSLNRTFKAETGQSPAKYLQRLRLEKARKLLEANTHSITEIALLCGFSDVSHFSNSFKDAFGVSPSAFKNNCL